MWQPRGKPAADFKIEDGGAKSIVKSENGRLSSTETSSNPYQTARSRNFQKAEVLFVFNLTAGQEYLDNWGKAPRVQLIVTAVWLTEDIQLDKTLGGYQNRLDTAEKRENCPCLKLNPVSSRYYLPLPSELSRLKFNLLVPELYFLNFSTPCI